MGAWERCAVLAKDQDGIVARWQLLLAGLSPGRIGRWLSEAMLHRQYCGVYSVGHAAVSPRGRLRAALLASGEGAILSHTTAAHLWGLIELAPQVIDVTVGGRHPRSKPGLKVHRVSQLSPKDLRLRHGLPVTSPAQTIIDLAATVTPDELDRLVAEARVRKLIRPGELEAAVERAGRRRGAAAARAFLAAEGDPGLTRSKAERILRRLVREARLSQPRSNARLAGYEVDFLWEREKLVVEFDSWRFHGHRQAFENDRRKDVALADAGYLVLRFTWRQLTDEPFAVIASIARALARREQAAAQTP